MEEFIPHNSWMRDIPDDTPVATLNIPGTHDSCSTDGPFGFAKTQNLDLADQLNAGIRKSYGGCSEDLHQLSRAASF